MKSTVYTSKQVNETEKLVTVIQSIPSDKRAILTALTESFISGMRVQERLMTAPNSTAASGKVEGD